MLNETKTKPKAHQPEVQKPRVRIKDACIITGWDGKNRLCGIVLDYPDRHQVYEGAVTNGKSVVTSLIVKQNGKEVETLRTIYIVENWI